MDAVAWRRGRLSLVLLAVAAIVFAACTSSGGTSSSAPAVSEAPVSEAPAARLGQRGARQRGARRPIAGGLLDKVLKAGKIVMSTDPQYPPQSELAADGELPGLRHRRRDRHRREAWAWRLPSRPRAGTSSRPARGADAGLQRWLDDDHDAAPGDPRLQRSYYYTPAQMAVRADSGITRSTGSPARRSASHRADDIPRLAQRALEFGSETPQATPPEGAQATTLDTDRLCAEAWKAGRTDFDGWLSSATTVQDAIDDGLPVMKVGDPVFFEPLAAAFDKSGPVRATWSPGQRNPRRDAADGTLKAMSEKWFGGPDRVARPGPNSE